ncbi:type II toxin-antitoxin system RelE/ParE family toxin [Rhizobium sp. BK376]|uniref:type II toxin-antitoxin system RelE/ParE family toxin n=1 Tax=Rhizobium sp. BK376 TaxID=2512149 RepID=UPI001052B561|nr:type II toxin-antitoxin system RelE/ParE family toxin [Rhizobium sp. BK376]TCR93334.1 addiction module RelE/StbE family toxin [Rhizobium sp. BK376]
MAELFWTADAAEDRKRIRAYIATENLDAAKELDLRFSEITERLRRFPFLGRLGRVPGTRELVPHKHYKIVYQVSGDIVIILTILHTAQQWPPLQD